MAFKDSLPALDRSCGPQSTLDSCFSLGIEFGPVAKGPALPHAGCFSARSLYKSLIIIVFAAFVAYHGQTVVGSGVDLALRLASRSSGLCLPLPPQVARWGSETVAPAPLVPTHRFPARQGAFKQAAVRVLDASMWLRLSTLVSLTNNLPYLRICTRTHTAHVNRRRLHGGQCDAVLFLRIRPIL